MRLHIGRQAPKGYRELPGAIHIGRGVWIMKLERIGPSLSKQEWHLLELLAPGVELYGLDLIAASGGKLKRGSVYVWLGRLEDGGYVARSAPDRNGRSRYAITASGREQLQRYTAAKE